VEDPANRRVDYRAGELTEADLEATPLAQFGRWYSDAVEHGVVEPNAMTLSTVDEDGVSARTVLLKGVDARGFVFYTNLRSRKARGISHDPRVALLFGWYGMQRQIAVRGRVEEVPRAETEAYFATRPHGSRIGAWASEQSQPVSGPDVLRERAAELQDRWPDEVPTPRHWGGFLVRVGEVEFWQGRTSRLHDRLVFVNRAAGTDLSVAENWRVERRQP